MSLARKLLCGTWRNAFTQALNANGGTFSGYAVRQLISSGNLLTSGGTSVRVTFLLSASVSATITGAYIGHAASSGDAYDFETTPTQLFFGGDAGVTVAANTSQITDPANFVIDPAKNLIVSFQCSSNTAVRYASSSPGNTGYYRLGGSASDVNTTGFSAASGIVYFVTLIESFE